MTAPVINSTEVFKADIFKGKVLFCTGGGSGIGRVVTEAVMRHGANAVIVGRNLERLTKTSAELSEATGQTCIAAQADVRQPKLIREAVNKTIERFGKIDFVVCGAAGNFLAPISELSENGFRTVIEIDTIGTFNTIKATLPHVRKTKGSYLHISATLHYRATPYQVHVSAAKAAVDAMSAVLAVEEGPHGVRSNVVAPGPTTNTAGMERLSARTPDGKRVDSDWISALGRAADSRDVANAAVFLLSGAASYITGQIVVVDGASESIRSPALPYPQSVLDPTSVKHLIAPKL